MSLIFFSACTAAEAKIFDIENFKLENGLEVIVIPNHRSPVVSHMIWYKFGASDDPIGKSGVAHFLEHLMFKGTPTVPDGKFSTTVKKLGGNDNAFTSNDYTAYYQNVPRQHLETMVQMEADRMRNLILNEQEVLSERQVIIEERKQRIDNQPQAKFHEQLTSALFINHPYGTPVIGWLHEIEELTREDAFSSYKKRYAPNNAILIVSGDITAKELKPLAEKYYGTLKTSILSERVRPKPAPIILEKRLLMKDSKVGQPIIMELYRAPHGSDPLELMTEIFGGSSTSRLYKNLVVEQKLAVSVSADYDPIRLNGSTFTIYATPTPETSINRLEKAIKTEIKKFIDRGITETELENAKKKKLARLNYYLDSLQGPAILLGRHLASGFSIDYIKETDKRINEITLEEINLATKKLFDKKNIPVTGTLLPEKSEEEK